MKKEEKRYSGIDIIKVLAIFLVPVLHFYLYFDFDKINMLHFGNLIQIMIRWVAFSCIGLFIMSSGYLLSKKEVSIKYYLKILYFLLLYAVALLMQHTIRNRFSESYLITYLIELFQFNGYFWYVSFYICLYSIIPYLNIVIEKMNKKKYLIFLGTLIFFTSLAITVNSIPNLKFPKIVYIPGTITLLWPGVYYYLGAYFRKFNPKINKKLSFIILILALLFISILNFIYSNKGPAFFTGGGYGNLISVIITTCIFSIIYNINFKTKISTMTFKYLASLTFETYLALGMSDILTRKVIKYITNNGFVEYKYIIIEAPINLLFAFIIGLVIHFLAKLIVFIFNKLFNEKRKNKIKEFIKIRIKVDL